ncbi:arginine-glutamic acid dipeptide repeats protein isoform X2 [Anoplophora glabripennis]|uniref:arginine-glutamic acid dipeptide repeats protein isoform X2 n=1 Tax=Anoplophora glabripennis TaxID=217634 RepID=UPI000874909D|nr:arginine-glutamic acid dipeptide repeats protein isoform X2 [Anoplophora glabripennis]
MSKRPVLDPFQPKITRNDRFAQMSHQEKVIEQKKREIQAKLEAKEKEKTAKVDNNSKSKNEMSKNKDSIKSPTSQKDVKNIFSNDGTFLDQFKQLKDAKKFDAKLKSFNKFRDHGDKSYNEERGKSNRWTPRRRSPSPKLQKRVSRFSSDKVPNFEPKITINTSFSTSMTQNFEAQPVTPQNVTGQPLLKNIVSTIAYPSIPQQTAVSETVITAPPVLLNVPPPQIVQEQISNTLVLTPIPPAQNVLVSTPLQNPILTTVTLPPSLVTTNIPISAVSAPPALPVPPPVLPTVELASIPPPNPIQVQNIPQPEPINTLNIPHPAPIQVQNIPTPSSIQLNEIPNPKPLDLLAIPPPNEDKNMSDPDFIKNIPPPNKSIPPPQITENQGLNAITCLPPNLMPPSQAIAQPTLAATSTQSILVHTVPPPSQIQALQNIQPAPSNQILQTQATFSSVTVALPVGVVQVSTTPTIANTIPSLMAQPILPPPGMGVGVNINCPPPAMHVQSSANGLQNPPPAFVTQPPSLTSQMPPMNVPPPTNVQLLSNVGFKDLNAGSPDYEAMASLGRMVAECGQGIEDIVRQRKNQDPSLWFLFHKESAAYRQYHGLVQQFKKEVEDKRMAETKEFIAKPEDIYEPEMALEETDRVMVKTEIKQEEESCEGSEKKRKRKSRWGDKECNVPPPTVVFNQASCVSPVLPVMPQPQINQGSVMLSKVTRSDPGLLQYAMNTYGSTNLTEEDWKKAEDHYKINLLYQDMVKKREEVERLKLAGQNKYDYDSDEETDGGTWEHKLREKEMMATQLWAQELTRQAEGKHHIGDFLPPEELKRFMEKSTAVKEGRLPNFSDYKEFKIKEDNIGFKMLQKLGWSEGEGLGSSGSGIVEPINKAPPREHTQGLGLNQVDEDEDEYESYRKRMMLAYRFRPNPLNNPRRPYY